MRAFKIFLGVVLTLAVLFLGALWFLAKTVDVNRFRSQLTESLKQQLKTDVVIEKLGLNVSLQGVMAQAEGVDIKDFAGFSADSVFRVARAQLTLDLPALVTRRQVVISSVRIERPQLQVVRNAAGVLNLQQFAPAAPAAKGRASRNPSEDQDPSGLGVPLFLVNDISIEQGSVSFLDQAQTPPAMVRVDQLRLKVKNFSLEEPFEVYLRAAVLGAEDNLEFSAKARMDLATAQCRLDDARLAMDLTSFSLENLEQAVPALKAAGLYGRLGGKVSMTISQMVVAPEGLLLLAGKGQAAVDTIATRWMAVPLEKIAFDFDVSERDLEIPEFFFRLGTGAVRGHLRLDEYLTRQKYAVSVQADKIALQQVVSEDLAKVKISGTAALQADVSGEGLDESKLMAALKGNGRLSLQDGKLEDVNILALVFERVPVLAELVRTVVENALPEKYQDIFHAKETAFKTLEAKVKAENGLVTVEDAGVDAGVFALNGGLSLDADQHLTAEGRVTLAADLSAKMADSAPEFAALMDSSRRIVIPLKPFAGPLTSFKMMPDAADIGKKMVVQRGKQELDNVLNKLLPPAPAQPAADADPAVEGSPENTGAETASPERQMIDNVLDSLFQ